MKIVVALRFLEVVCMLINRFSLDPDRMKTLAFHFRFIMPGEYLHSDKVAVLLLERILRVIRPDLAKVGMLFIHMGKLIYSHQLDDPIATALWNSLTTTAGHRFCAEDKFNPTELPVPIDRIYVVTLTGCVDGFQKAWSKRLVRYVRHPFLFSLEVDVYQRPFAWAYLAQPSKVGELSADWSLILDFESMEFEFELPQMLERLHLSDHCSPEFQQTMLTLLEQPLRSSNGPRL